MHGKNDRDFTANFIWKQRHSLGIKRSDEMFFINMYKIAGNGYAYFNAISVRRPVSQSGIKYIVPVIKFGHSWVFTAIHIPWFTGYYKLLPFAKVQAVS